MGEFSPHPRTGLRRVINAFRWSILGFRSAFRKEAAFRQELAALAVLLPLGAWLAATRVEAVLLMASLLLVPIVELLNSALENVVDRIGTEHHKLSGRAKDQGSAAVFLAIALAVMTWLMILLPWPCC